MSEHIENDAPKKSFESDEWLRLVELAKKYLDEDGIQFLEANLDLTTGAAFVGAHVAGKGEDAEKVFEDADVLLPIGDKEKLSEIEPDAKIVIVHPALDDVGAYRRMQMRSWMETYENEAAGVTYDWLKAQTERYLTPEAIAHSKEKVRAILEDTEHQFLYIAKAGKEVVGMINTTKFGDKQRLEAMYVDSGYYGKGVAQQLMDTALSHLDPTQPVDLEVIEYNKRAQRFYEKYGFVIVPESEHMYAEIMPSLKMTKPGETHEI